MLWTRVASGVILGPLFLALVYLEFPYFHVLVAALAGIMAWEFARMAAKDRRYRITVTGAVLVGTLAPTAFLFTGASLNLAVALGGFYILLWTILTAGIQRIRAGSGWATVNFAAAYAGLPALALLYVMGVGGFVSVFWLVTIVWATDIGAYACGRLIGGAKLAPRISPNKTWSGAVGGVIWAVIASSVLLWAFDSIPTIVLGSVAAFTSIMSQLGDLFESALKRRYKVKDSGDLIPGHGGAMDRFDGLWAAAPVAALFCAIFGGGVQTW